MIGALFHLIFWLIGLVIALACAVWAWNDANERGKPGVLVGVLVFLFPVVGLIAWLIFRPERGAGSGL